MLIPLHTKSHYSLGFGTASIPRLVERARALGLSALALTDMENLYGQVIFHRLAREKGLRPITGVELQASSSSKGRSVLLAQNPTGYQNLCRIITRRKLGTSPDQLSKAFENQGRPKEEAREDLMESLRGRSDGLIVLTDDPPTLEKILSLPGFDRKSARLLLIRPGKSMTAERKVAEASSRLDIPLVADPDIIFLDPEDRPFHSLQVAIGTNKLISDVEREGLVEKEGRHFPGPRECESLFGDVPEAVEEAHRIAERCELDLRKRKPIFPSIPLPEGETAYSHLAKIAFRGLERRFSRITPRHVERLAKELQIIADLGFCEYFIVVGDILRFARERGIEVVGRGSGAGSLVAHVLGVTNVDPIEHGLYFERFLHPGRTDLPDIDIDLCWIRRDEVIDYVYQTYGHDRVAMISSHVTFQPHLAFREAVKAFGVPLEQVNRYSRRIPYLHAEVTSKTPLRDLIASSPLSKSIPMDEEPFRTALPLAERLLNQPHHLSVHPGGIVIGDQPIDTYVPLERAAKGIVVTQYDMYSIEDVGLVKIDLLGNRCLTELQETLDFAKADGGVSLRLADIPDEDPKALEILQSARTLGCFQLESPAMRALLSKVHARNIRDCITAVAIIRPGAAAGGAKEAYIRRKCGEESPEYLHPSLRKLLEETYGVVIYEEDVMCIASAIARISLAEGDQLRSAIKKCRHPDDIRGTQNDFLRRSVQNGVEPDVALAVWEELKKFASYCFSKAHASGYGMLAYQSAYLKAHFPVEFACALLNNHAGMYSARTIAEEVKRMGVRILSPSVNRSEVRFTVEREPSARASSPARWVRTGLSRVKGLSYNSIEAILSARASGGPFQGLGDFLCRAPMPRRETEALILSGAFDDLPLPRGAKEPLNQPQLLWELGQARTHNTQGVNGSSWITLRGGSPDYPPLKPYDSMTRIQNELEILEIAITDHPLRLLREEARKRGCLSTVKAAQEVGRQVRVAGIVAAIRKVRTKKGEMMQFLTIEDEEGLLESTLFPATYQAFGSRLRTVGPYVVEGRIEEDHRAINLNVSRVEGWDGKDLT